MAGHQQAPLQATQLFYRFIIDDVVAKGRPAAVQDGAGP
jgi:hypothetical protein